MAGFLKVAGTQDVPAGQGKMFSVGGKHIALFNVEGTYYAISIARRRQRSRFFFLQVIRVA